MLKVCKYFGEIGSISSSCLGRILRFYEISDVCLLFTFILILPDGRCRHRKTKSLRVICFLALFTKFLDTFWVLFFVCLNLFRGLICLGRVWLEIFRFAVAAAFIVIFKQFHKFFIGFNVRHEINFCRFKQRYKL